MKSKSTSKPMPKLISIATLSVIFLALACGEQKTEGEKVEDAKAAADAVVVDARTAEADASATVEAAVAEATATAEGQPVCKTATEWKEQEDYHARQLTDILMEKSVLKSTLSKQSRELNEEIDAWQRAEWNRLEEVWQAMEIARKFVKDCQGSNTRNCSVDALEENFESHGLGEDSVLYQRTQ